MKKIAMLFSMCVTTTPYLQAAAPEDNSKTLKIGWGLCRVEGTNPTKEHIAVTLVTDDKDPLPKTDFFALYCGDLESVEAVSAGSDDKKFNALDEFLDEEMGTTKQPYLKCMQNAFKLSDAHIKFFIGDTGATALTAGIRHNLKPMLYIVWSSGDSSATLVNNDGNSELLTPAHTTANAQESKRIRTAHQSPEEEDLVPETLSNMYITRIVGHKKEHPGIAPIGVTYKPETKKISLETKHTTLVLASETLFSDLHKSEAAKIVHSTLSKSEKLLKDPEANEPYQINGTHIAAKHAAYKLCKRAKKTGQSEHITAMVIAFIWPKSST